MAYWRIAISSKDGFVFTNQGNGYGLGCMAMDPMPHD